MGRRYKNPPWEPEFNDQPVDGVDTANKVFFEAPKVITIGTSEYMTTSCGSRTTTTVGTPGVLSDSPVRLASSRLARICPASEQPKTVVYELGLHPSNEELTEYLKHHSEWGFDKGAIVARRYAQNWRRTQCTEWGVITYVQDVAPHSSVDFRGPYNIQWFDNAKECERGWAEDLIIIYAALPKDVLEMVITTQGAPA